RKFQYKKTTDVSWIDAGATTGSYGTGTFSFVLTSLTEGTGYEYKAMAHNSAGWGTGSVVQFTTNNNGLNIDINLSPAQDISFTRPLTITGTATGPGADNVAWLVEIKDGGVIASFTLANGPEFACDYTPVENLPVVGDYSVRVVATPEAGAPVEKVIPFNIYNYPLKITDLTVADNGATHTLSAIVTNLENSSQPVVGIGQITGPDGSVVFLEPADQITIAALGSQTIVFTFNTPQAAGTYKAEMFIWLFNDGIRTVGTPKDTTFVI
ncbi:MAG: fibronectin type III domain-containing protein, partial [Eubacteriales bacterium]